MSGVGILLEHEIKSRLQLFRSHLPGDESAGGKICGKQRLAHPTNSFRFEHLANAFQHGRKRQPASARNFRERIADEASNLVL